MPGSSTACEVVAGADAVEDPLLHRRHQLAVPVHETLGPERQHRVVERARPLVLALVDADRRSGCRAARRRRRAPARAAPRRRPSSPRAAPRARPSRRTRSRRAPTRWTGTAARTPPAAPPAARPAPRPRRAGRRPSRRCASASSTTGVAWIAATRTVSNVGTRPILFLAGVLLGELQRTRDVQVHAHRDERPGLLGVPPISRAIVSNVSAKQAATGSRISGSLAAAKPCSCASRWSRSSSRPL